MFFLSENASWFLQFAATSQGRELPRVSCRGNEVSFGKNAAGLYSAKGNNAEHLEGNFMVLARGMTALMSNYSSGVVQVAWAYFR